MKIRSFKAKLFPLLMIFVILAPLLFPIKVEAHETYFMQVLIDQNTHQYQVNVIKDDVSREGKHIENNMADFGSLIKTDNGRNAVPSSHESDEGKKMYEEAGLKGLGEGIAIFSFSPQEQGEVWGGKKKNDATEKDVNRAYLIRDALAPGLNDALFIVNDKKRFKSDKEMAEKMQFLAKGGTDKDTGWTVEYGKRAYDDKKLTDHQKNTLGISKSDFVKISKGTEKYEFIYRIPKGYVKSGDYKPNELVGEYSYDGDTEYMSWQMLAFQGNYAMFVKGWTMNDAMEIQGVNAGEEFLVGIVQSTLNGLRNLLGLYSMNEIIYNEGIRGSTAWVHGAMPIEWHDNVVKYHMVFQAFAWTLISFAIVKSLITRNLATINPSMRVSLMEQIQNLLITGFILSAIFPIIAMFMYLNIKIVDVFASFAPEMTDFAGLNNYANALSGMILQFFYFIIAIYLNFVYIMRSITLAILIALAPIFVVTIAFGGQWKMLFGVWMRELLANIFLQSFHAFILGFFITTSISSRGIEGAVVAFAMIPLTEFFRSLIMGQGGGMTTQLGMQATSGLFSAGTKALGMAGKGIGNKKGGGANTGDPMMDMAMDEDASRRQNSDNMSKTQQQPIKSHQMGALGQKQAMSNKQIPLDAFTKGTAGNYLEPSTSGLQAGMQDAKSMLTPKSAGSLANAVGSGAFSALKAGAYVGLGAGAMLALGGSNPHIMEKAGNMIMDGKDEFKGGVVDPVASRVAGAYDSVKAGIAMDNSPSFKSPVNTSGMTQSQLGITGGKNANDFNVHRSANAVREESGIISANMSGSGDRANAIYQYDSSRLSQQDSANIKQYADTFQNGSPEAKQHLREQGVENVARRTDGGYAVTYNRTGMEKMGISSVNTVGSGDNARIVETKRQDQPIPTFNTISASQYAPPAPPPPTPQPSRILDASGNPFGSSTPPPPASAGQGIIMN